MDTAYLTVKWPYHGDCVPYSKVIVAWTLCTLQYSDLTIDTVYLTVQWPYHGNCVPYSKV